MSAHNLLYNSYLADHTQSDPGDGGSIQADRDHGLVLLESGSSGETRTLKDPLKAGIMLSICLETDGGGNVVVTAETAINQTGNNTITLADAFDTILLLSIPDGSGGYKWKILGNDGAALSTV